MLPASLRGRVGHIGSGDEPDDRETGQPDVVLGARAFTLVRGGRSPQRSFTGKPVFRKEGESRSERSGNGREATAVGRPYGCRAGRAFNG